MISIMELALVAIAIAWLGLIIAISVFYRKINHEKQEIMRIKEKIDFHEKSIKKISGFVVDVKREHSAL